MMVRGAPGGTKEAERLGVMLREIERMGTVLEGFKTLTRPMSALTPSVVLLDDVVRDVVLLHQGMAADVRCRLEAPSGVGPGVLLMADGAKLRQSLTNLVQNGIEAAGPGGHVHVGISVLGRTATVTVQDSGPGLDEERRRHLFEPGFTTKASGSGIGLALARSIAEQHEGSLTLDNCARGGCVARLSLPLTDLEVSDETRGARGR